MIVPAYSPGSWWVAVADGGCVALPGEADSATVVALWRALRDGAGLAELLTYLLRPGISAVPPFVLVDVQGRTVHAVVRGDVVVEVTTGEGTRTISGARMTTWTEAVLGDARRLVVRTPGAEEPDSTVTIPVLSGVVRAGRVVVDLSVAEQSPHAAGEGEPATGTAPDREPAVPAPAPTTARAATPAPAPTPAPALTVVRPVAPHLAADEEQEPGDDPVPAWARVRPLRPEASGVALEEVMERAPEHGSSDESHLTAGTAPVPIVRAAPDRWREQGTAPEPATPAPEVVGPDPDDDGGHGQDHDGLTVLSSDVVALRRQLPEWAGDAVPSLAVPTPRNPAPAKLVLSTGLVVSLNRPVLLGRAPQVTRVSNNEIPRLVTLASPNQDISRTHAEVRMDGEDVVVTDLRSTNGVLLLRQGAGPQRLHPGEPTVVEPGVVVDLGEGATFLVEAGG